MSFELPPEAMRALGYRVVDLLVDRLARLREQRVVTKGSAAALLERLARPFPEEGGDANELLEWLEREALDNRARVNHPRFFAFVPSPGNFVGAMGDALASGLNVFAGTWLGGSGPSALELVTLDWLRRECGLPESSAGLLVSGGSAANLTALAAARHSLAGEEWREAAVYFSAQTHSAVERALRVLGFEKRQIRKLPCGADFRLPLETLARAVAEDRAAGLRPFCVVANAGTTNTGAVDPLPELARYCRRENLWMHVDGAYGAAAVLCEEGRRLLAGLGEADSLALDPHKWLFQPFETGCVFVRSERALAEAFRIEPEYLDDVHRHAETNFCDRGIQLTRGCRALKLWLSLQVYGVRAFREAIAHGFEMAREAGRALEESGRWEIVTPPQMAIVTFRRRGWSGAEHPRLIEAALEDGYMFLTSTTLDGQAALRLCTTHPATTVEDVRGTVARLDRLAGQVR